MSAQPTEIITHAEAKAAEAERKSVLVRIADRYGIDAKVMMGTLRATVFKGDVTNEQLAMLLVVADQHKLNPFTKEIYAFPSRQGIVPVVGVDGWARIINEHPQFDGMDFEQDDEKCTCKMYRKDRTHPVVITEYLNECKRPTDPWTTHPKRMLRHKAMIQAARIAFAFAGIYDPDEGERVLAAENAIDVTPDDGEMTRGELGPPRKVSAKKLKDLAEGCNKAVAADDGPALLALRASVDNEEWLYFWGKMRSYERTGITKLLEKAKKTHIARDDIGPWASGALASSEDPDATWRLVEEAYADHDQEPPTDLQIVRDDRKRELGMMQ